jgi:hypothetical protein
MKKRRFFLLSLAALFAIGAVALYALSGINFGRCGLHRINGNRS